LRHGFELGRRAEITEKPSSFVHILESQDYVEDIIQIL